MEIPKPSGLCKGAIRLVSLIPLFAELEKKVIGAVAGAEDLSAGEEEG